jgi:hypothetical protein
LTQAAAIVALRRRGLPRADIAPNARDERKAGLGREYNLGRTDNADDKIADVYPRTMRLVAAKRERK